MLCSFRYQKSWQWNAPFGLTLRETDKQDDSFNTTSIDEHNTADEGGNDYYSILCFGIFYFTFIEAHKKIKEHALRF